MSNKLTREVRYLSESDRPKKVEPLSFTKWKEGSGSITRNQSSCQIWDDSIIDEYATKYSTYLQEFSAEEKAVELTFYLGRNGRVENTHTIDDTDIVTFLGKCPTDGDMFCIKSDDGIIRIYLGKLNSGKF